MDAGEIVERIEGQDRQDADRAVIPTSEGGFRSLKAYCEDRSIGKGHFHNLMLAGEILDRLECKDGSFVSGTGDCIPITERQQADTRKLPVTRWDR